VTKGDWTLDEVVADQCDAFDSVVAELEEEAVAEAHGEEVPAVEFLPVGLQQDLFAEVEG
jgi:hypothetical protein